MIARVLEIAWFCDALSALRREGATVMEDIVRKFPAASFPPSTWSRHTHQIGITDRHRRNPHPERCNRVSTFENIPVFRFALLMDSGLSTDNIKCDRFLIIASRRPSITNKDSDAERTTMMIRGAVTSLPASTEPSSCSKSSLELGCPPEDGRDVLGQRR